MNRAKVQRDSINYFPPSAHQACRIGFFADLDRPPGWDEVELSSIAPAWAGSSSRSRAGSTTASTG